MANIKIITFYSFKGGVGRTMALLNTAYQLVHWGHNVLMIDADLEAPGLTYLFEDIVQPSQPGFIEFFDACKRDFMRRFNKDKKIEPLRHENLRKFWDHIPIKPAGENKSGHLALMPTGQDTAQYVANINRLDIARLYRQRIGLAIAKECQAWLKQMPFDQMPFDYILIDSRTGFNEASGLSVNALAEALVVLTALNVQNVKGTKRFLQKVGLLDSERIPLIFVISPIPPWEDEQKEMRFHAIEETFKRSNYLRIHYHPALALQEEDFIEKYPNSDLAVAYEKLATEILKINQDDFDSIFKSIRDDISGKDYSRILDKLRRAANQSLARAVAELRFYLSDPTEADAPFEWIMDAYQQLADWQNEATTYNEWGVAIGSLASRKAEAGEIETARRYFEEAFDKYAQAAKMDAAFYEALYNWGSHLGALAALEVSQQNLKAARNCYEAAFEKYAEAVKLDPDRPEAYQNWAADLAALREMEAAIAPNQEGKERYQKFYDRFASVAKRSFQLEE
jgi:cellulose biosynthesis protein BcsQ